MTVATQTVTVEAFERMARDGSWELIDGELIEVSPTGALSGKVSNLLAFFVTAHVRAERLGAVFAADTGFVLFPDRDTVRAPDVAFVRTDRLPLPAEQTGFLRLAPDLAAEVRSPSDRMPDLLAKAAMYLEAGVPLVWLVDPGPKRIAVYTQDGPVATLHAGDSLDGGDVLPGFSLPVTELFV